MEDKTAFVNGQFIDARVEKPGFLESNDPDALTFYRCVLCHRVVNLFDLREHKACPHCGHGKMSPTNLTLWEKIVQIIKHPRVWEWKKQKNRL
jgi:RNA polymerase subunit RPABC4/transcription elongation factor Spt4